MDKLEKYRLDYHKMHQCVAGELPFDFVQLAALPMLFSFSRQGAS